MVAYSTLPPPHPAKFSNDIMAALQRAVGEHFPPSMERFIRNRRGLLLDPFAGVGTLGKYIRDRRTEWNIDLVGVEIEHEWASQGPRAVQADSMYLPFKPGTFDGIITSPTYGNRMADHHENKDKCKPCQGTGVLNKSALSKNNGICKSCDGKGVTRRHTYRHYLDRMPAPQSSATLQWGLGYQRFHEIVWAECTRMCHLGSWFFLNTKNHIRKGEEQTVSQWHVGTLSGLGWRIFNTIEIGTNGLADGANQKLRTESEYINLFELVEPQQRNGLNA